MNGLLNEIVLRSNTHQADTIPLGHMYKLTILKYLYPAVCEKCVSNFCCCCNFKIHYYKIITNRKSMIHKMYLLEKPVNHQLPVPPINNKCEPRSAQPALTTE